MIGNGIETGALQGLVQAATEPAAEGAVIGPSAIGIGVSLLAVPLDTRGATNQCSALPECSDRARHLGGLATLTSIGGRRTTTELGEQLVLAGFVKGADIRLIRLGASEEHAQCYPAEDQPYEVKGGKVEQIAARAKRQSDRRKQHLEGFP